MPNTRGQSSSSSAESSGKSGWAVFDERVFPGALEDVVLLFAEDRGAAGLADVRLMSCSTVADVEQGLAAAVPSPSAGQASVSHSHLLSQSLPDKTLDLYRRIHSDTQVQSLGDIASVDIGVVTGANKFFLLSKTEAEPLHERMLRPAIGKAAQLAGARLSMQDYLDLLAADQPALMFAANATLPKKVLRSAGPAHISHGESEGFHERYKCRIRDPWWELPISSEPIPELLLTYCSNDHPRMALNEASVMTTNTLHGVRVFDPGSAASLAAGFFNSLTLLSAEIVGRS